jgi:hypothetical protein
MHNTLRTILIFLIGVVVGAALAVVALILLLRTDAIQSFIRDSMVAAQKWPDVTTLLEQSGGTPTPQQTKTAQEFFNTPLSIKVPAADGTPEYALNLTALINDLQAIASSTNELGPILLQMNTQSLGGNFNGFFDLVVKAKTLVAQQKALSAQFAQHLTALNVSNQKTPDVVTKSLTQAMLSAGQPVPTDFNAYLATLDQLLSGSVPSAALIQDMGAKANVFSGDLSTFGSSMQKLLLHFGQTAGVTPAQ